MRSVGCVDPVRQTPLPPLPLGKSSNEMSRLRLHPFVIRRSDDYSELAAHLAPYPLSAFAGHQVPDQCRQFRPAFTGSAGISADIA